MKTRLLGYLPCLLAAAALAAFGFALRDRAAAERRAVETWAERDLAARTQLAAESIRDALATGDYARLRAFADDRRADGLRLTVLSRPGGMVFDSVATASGNHGGRPEVKRALATGEGSAIRLSATTGQRALYCARAAGNDFVVRLAIPYARVVEPLRRHRPALVLAALLGASSILLVLLFTFHLVSRVRALARERDMQRRLLEEARRVADFRRDFIANVSHELKTPLTAVRLSAEMLREGRVKAEAQARYLDVIVRESERLTRLVDNVLDFGRLERGRRKFNLEARDVNELLSVAEAQRPRVEAAGLTLTVRPAPAPVVRTFDSDAVGQVLVNLVDNAVKYAASGKTVEVSVGERGEIAVADRGPGIAAKHRSRIFERFYRCDDSITAKSSGSGLGLSIASRLMEGMGGELAFAPRTGGGAVFTIKFGEGT